MCGCQETTMAAREQCSVQGFHCRGLARNGWDDVPIIACETQGTNSFAEMREKRELVTLRAITSIAKSLGALRVSEACARASHLHSCMARTLTCGCTVRPRHCASHGLNKSVTVAVRRCAGVSPRGAPGQAHHIVHHGGQGGRRRRATVCRTPQA